MTFAKHAKGAVEAIGPGLLYGSATSVLTVVAPVALLAVSTAATTVLSHSQFPSAAALGPLLVLLVPVALFWPPVLVQAACSGLGLAPRAPVLVNVCLTWMSLLLGAVLPNAFAAQLGRVSALVSALVFCTIVLTAANAHYRHVRLWWPFDGTITLANGMDWLYERASAHGSPTKRSS